MLTAAAALGARAIVISSSDETLARAKALGGSPLINYAECVHAHSRPRSSGAQRAAIR
jgi:NADPH:quinone reductase-like Zn-dependent oxidoreductase